MTSETKNFRFAFTLMEMVVSIGILVIVILSVGVIFQSAGRTVGVSQASMEMLSNVRSVQLQIQNDFAGLDRDGFLVIRCSTDPSNSNRRFDQISFISYGSFPNRGGTTAAGAAFTDNNTVSPAAFIWYGQLAQSTNQSTKLPLNQLPFGTNDVDFTLGRRAMLLAPKSSSTENITPNGTSVDAYQNTTGQFPLAAIDYSTPAANPDFSTDITEARLTLAACTPGEIMSYLSQAINGVRGSTNARYEADHFCYRIGALRSVYDANPAGDFVNGYFRMTPIAMQGVSSFAIDWTDGTTYGGGEVDVTTGITIPSGSPLIGTTKWFGMGVPNAGNQTGLAKGASYQNQIVDPAGLQGTSVGPGGPSGDNYTAVFSYDNRSKWPVALRFRYHIADPNGRLQNGRDFVEIVKLP